MGERLPKGLKRLPDGRLRVRTTATERGTGRRLEAQRTLPAGTTPGQALDELEALRRELSSTGQTTRPAGPPTWRIFAERWIEARAARVRRTTALSYAQILASHVLPRIGSLRIDETRRSDLERLVAELESGPLAPSTRGLVWRVTLCLVRDGCAEEGLPDPSTRVRGPSVASPPAGRALSLIELRGVIGAASCLRDRALVALLALTGLRATEAARLRRVDIDLDKGWAAPSHSKTAAGLGRQIPLSPELVELLGAWLAEAPESPWVFPGDPASKPLHRVSILRIVRTTSQRAGSSVSPHDLRRTFVTLLRRAGVDTVAVQALVGHTRAEQTAAYQRVSDEDRRGALRVLSGGLCGTQVWDRDGTDGDAGRQGGGRG